MDSPSLAPHIRLDRYLAGDRGRAAALARRCEVTEATVSGWRRGHIRPSGEAKRAAIEEMTGIARDDWETARTAGQASSDSTEHGSITVDRDPDFDQSRTSITGTGV